MHKPKHIQLLEFLENHGSGKLVNISPFMVKHFIRPQTEQRDEYQEMIREPILFLMDLNRRQFIKADDWDDGEKHVSFIPQPSFRPHFERGQWYSDFETNVYITSTGLDYLDSYRTSQINSRLNNSFINVNGASLRNYRNQIIIGAITIGLAGASCYMSYQSNHKADLTAISVDSLRLEIKKWRLQKTQTPSLITSQILAPHK